MDIMPSLALVFRRAMVFRRDMVFRRAMVFRKVLARIMVATTKDLLKLERNLFITMVDMGITNLGAMGMDTRVEVSARRNFTITTDEMQRIPAPTWSVER